VGMIIKRSKVTIITCTWFLIFLWFDFGFFDAKGIPLSLKGFPNHWHNFIWPRLKIFKNGHKPYVRVLQFLKPFSFFFFDPKDHDFGFKRGWLGLLMVSNHLGKANRA
jgi:hypothetical protein